MSISRIDTTSVHAINSAQVITSLSSVLKELVENALDAGSPAVEVKCKNYGLDQVQVLDAGRGIDKEDFEAIGLRGFTSKLATFNDLDKITTLGFRGEAFSSLCGLASVSLHTATRHTTPMGTALDFNRDGSVANQTQSARKQGTTVTVANLFHTIPVRQRELKKNVKREFMKMTQTLQAYALAQPNVKFTLSNQTAEKKPPAIVFQTTGKGNIKQVFGTIFNAKAVQALVDFDLSFSFKAEKSVVRLNEASGASHVTHPITEARVQGLMSKAEDGAGRPSPDRQFFFLNSRPFQPQKLQKAFHEAYRAYNPDQVPALIVNLSLAADAYDVNLSPDKRTILFHSENNLIDALKAALDEFLMPARDFAVSQPSTREPKETQQQHQKQPSLLRASSSSSKASSDADEADVLDLSRSSSFSRGQDVMDLEEAENDASEAVEAEIQAPPRKRQRISESPEEEEEISERTAPERELDHRLSPSVPPSEARSPERDSSPELEILPSQPPPPVKPAVRQETLDTTTASWSKIFATKHSSSSASSPSTPGQGHTTGLSQRFSRTIPPPQHQQTLRRDIRGISEDAEPESIANDSNEELEEEEEEEEVLVMPPAPRPQSRPPHPPAAAAASRKPPKTLVNDARVLVLDPIPGPSKPKESLENSPVSTPEIEPSTSSSSTISAFNATARLDLEQLERAYSYRKRYLERLKGKGKEDPSAAHSDVLEGAAIDAAEAEAQATLSRTVQQPDFAKMTICGQFNLGFIIARRIDSRNGRLEDDLFIIDQHASDEKYNFETLQANTKMESQAELIPRVLDLPAMDEHLAMDCKPVLEANGFKISIDEEAPSGQRVKLLTHPVSKNTTLGVEDFEELLHLLRESEGRMQRPSRIRAMLASRACRMSVMVGKSLKGSKMRSIIDHMGTMKQPWACPHGRPTMRHLTGVEEKYVDARYRSIITANHSAFGV